MTSVKQMLLRVGITSLPTRLLLLLILLMTMWVAKGDVGFGQQCGEHSPGKEKCNRKINELYCMSTGRNPGHCALGTDPGLCDQPYPSPIDPDNSICVKCTKRSYSPAEEECKMFVLKQIVLGSDLEHDMTYNPDDADWPCTACFPRQGPPEQTINVTVYHTEVKTEYTSGHIELKYTHVPSSFEVEPSDITVNEGQTVVLVCQTKGQGKVTWSKDGFQMGVAGERDLEDFPRMSIVGDESRGVNNLQIRRSKVTDQGKYECVVVFTDHLLNKKSRAASLTVVSQAAATNQTTPSPLIHCLNNGDNKDLIIPNPLPDLSPSDPDLLGVFWSRITTKKKEKEYLLKYVPSSNSWIKYNNTRAEVYGVWGLKLRDVTVDDSGLYTLAVGLDGKQHAHKTNVIVKACHGEGGTSRGPTSGAGTGGQGGSNTAPPTNKGSTADMATNSKLDTIVPTKNPASSNIAPSGTTPSGTTPVPVGGGGSITPRPIVSQESTSSVTKHALLGTLIGLLLIALVGAGYVFMTRKRSRDANMHALEAGHQNGPSAGTTRGGTGSGRNPKKTEKRDVTRKKSHDDAYDTDRNDTPMDADADVDDDEVDVDIEDDEDSGDFDDDQ